MKLLCALSSMLLAGCVMGIPDADGWKPPKVVPCTPILVDGVQRACLSEREFERWKRRNLPESF